MVLVGQQRVAFSHPLRCLADRLLWEIMHLSSQGEEFPLIAIAITFLLPVGVVVTLAVR